MNQQSNYTGNSLTMQKQNLSISTMPEPWQEHVDGNTLLSEIVTVIERFIVCSKETLIAAALWVIVTWFVDDVQVAPIALITAPDKQCGKTQLLTIMAKLSREPLPISNATVAAIFRMIEKYAPTIFIDEADSFLNDNEELRGVLNSGHTRDAAFTLRCVNDSHEPKPFSTWSFKAVCGIGKPAPTIVDRSIILSMRRKTQQEKVERLRHVLRKEPTLFSDLVSKLARFVEDHHEAMREAEPELPEELSDRAQDNWEPLLMIADMAGGDWPKLAREAAVKISKADDGSDSTDSKLLADIREVLRTKHKGDTISLKELRKYLCEDDEMAWSTYDRGYSITTRFLAKKLGEYGVKTKQHRSFNGKGYEIGQFTEVFERYLPFEPPENSET